MKKILCTILIFTAILALCAVLGSSPFAQAAADEANIVIIFHNSSNCYVAKNPDETEKINIVFRGGVYTATVTLHSECPVRKLSVRDKSSNWYKDVARGTTNPEGGDFTISFVIDNAMLNNSVFSGGEYLIQLFPDGIDSTVYNCDIEDLSLSDFNCNIKAGEGDTTADMGNSLSFKLFSGEKVTVETAKLKDKKLYSLRGGPAEYFFDKNGKTSFVMPSNDLSLDAVYGSYLTLNSDDAGHMDTVKSAFALKGGSNMAYSGEDVTLTVYPLLSGAHKGCVVSKLIKESAGITGNIFEYETGAASYFERKADGSVTYTFTMESADVSIKPVFEIKKYEITFGDTQAGEGILSAYDIVLTNNDTVPKEIFKLSEAIGGKKYYAKFGDSLTYKINVADPQKYSVKDTEISANLKGRSAAVYLYQSDEDGAYNHATGVTVKMTQGDAEITVGKLVNNTFRVTLEEASSQKSSAYLIRTGESANYGFAEYPWDQAKPIYLRTAPGYRLISTPYFIKDNDETRQRNAFKSSTSGWYFYLEGESVTVYYSTEKIPLTASISSAGGNAECLSWLEVERGGETLSSKDGKLTCFVGETVTIKTAPGTNYELLNIAVNNASLVGNTFEIKGNNISVVVNYALHKSQSLPPEIELEGINTAEKVFNTVGLTGELLKNYGEGYDLKLKIKNAALPVNIETLKEYFSRGVYNFAGKRIAVKELSVYGVEISLDLIHFDTAEVYRGEMAENKKLSIYLPVKADSAGKDFVYIARYNKKTGEMTILQTNRRVTNGQVYYDFNATEFTTYLVFACNYDLEASANLEGTIEADGLHDPMFNRVIYGGVLPGNTEGGGKGGKLEWYFILIIVLGSAAVIAGAVVFALFKSGIFPRGKKGKGGKAPSSRGKSGKLAARRNKSKNSNDKKADPKITNDGV